MTTSAAQSPPEGIDVRRAATRTALLGIAFAILVLASYLILTRAPGIEASNEEYMEFYSSSDRRWAIVAGLYLMPFAGIAFLWFVVLLRMWISKSATRVDELFSNVQLVSGIIYLALFFASAASISVLAASAEFSSASIDPETARSFTHLGWGLVLVFSMRMAAIFVITTSSLARRHGFLPTWFVVLGYLVGLFLLLSAVLTTLLILVLPLWVLGLGTLLLIRARSLPAGPAEAAPAAGA